MLDYIVQLGPNPSLSFLVLKSKLKLNTDVPKLVAVVFVIRFYLRVDIGILSIYDYSHLMKR